MSKLTDVEAAQAAPDQDDVEFQKMKLAALINCMIRYRFMPRTVRAQENRSGPGAVRT
jgi:hypothetical protein